MAYVSKEPIEHEMRQHVMGSVSAGSLSYNDTILPTQVTHEIRDDQSIGHGRFRQDHAHRAQGSGICSPRSGPREGKESYSGQKITGYHDINPPGMNFRSGFL